MSRFWRWILCGAWAVAIVCFSAIPAQKLPEGGFTGLDKLVHACEFGLLGFLAARAWGRFWPVVLAAILFGALDEVHQVFTPGRTPSVYDALADALGAFLGAALVLRPRGKTAPSK